MSRLKYSLYKTYFIYGIFYVESVMKFLRFKKKSDLGDDFVIEFFKAFSIKKKFRKIDNIPDNHNVKVA